MLRITIEVKTVVTFGGRLRVWLGQGTWRCFCGGWQSSLRWPLWFLHLFYVVLFTYFTIKKTLKNKIYWYYNLKVKILKSAIYLMVERWWPFKGYSCASFLRRWLWVGGFSSYSQLALTLSPFQPSESNLLFSVKARNNCVYYSE